jgi:hypothetical protein
MPELHSGVSDVALAYARLNINADELPASGRLNQPR